MNILDLSCFHLNYIRNIFGSLQDMVMGTTNIMIFGECKIDVCFPTAQITAKGYHEPHRLDMSGKRRCILNSVNSSVSLSHLNCVKKFLIKKKNLTKEKLLAKSIYRLLKLIFFI